MRKRWFDGGFNTTIVKHFHVVDLLAKERAQLGDESRKQLKVLSDVRYNKIWSFQMSLLDQPYHIPWPVDPPTDDSVIEKLIILKLVARAVIHHADVDKDIYERFQVVGDCLFTWNTILLVLEQDAASHEH